MEVVAEYDGDVSGEVAPSVFSDWVQLGGHTKQMHNNEMLFYNYLCNVVVRAIVLSDLPLAPSVDILRKLWQA